MRRHAWRHPQLLRRPAAQSVLSGAGVRGHGAIQQPDALALRVEPPVPAVHRHHPEPEQHRRADLRLSTVRAEQAVRQGCHRQRQLHLRAAVDRDWRLRGRGVGAPERGSVLLAAQAPRHRVRRLGTALVSRRAQHRGVSPWRLVDRADAGLPVRSAVGHARQRRSGAGRQPLRHRATRPTRKGSSSTGSSRASASGTPRPATTPCWRSRPRMAAPSRTSWSASPSSAAPR